MAKIVYNHLEIRTFGKRHRESIFFDFKSDLEPPYYFYKAISKIFGTKATVSGKYEEKNGKKGEILLINGEIIKEI